MRRISKPPAGGIENQDCALKEKKARKSVLPLIDELMANNCMLEDDTSRKTFSEALCRIAFHIRLTRSIRNLNELRSSGASSTVIAVAEKKVERGVETLRHAVELCNRSSKPEVYARFLSWKPLVLDVLFSFGQLFNNRTELPWRIVPDRKSQVGMLISDLTRDMSPPALQQLGRILIDISEEEMNTTRGNPRGNDAASAAFTARSMLSVILNSREQADCVLRGLNCDEMIEKSNSLIESNPSDWDWDGDVITKSEWLAARYVLQEYGVFPLIHEGRFSLELFDRFFTAGAVTGFVVKNTGILGQMDSKGCADLIGLYFYIKEDEPQSGTVQHELQHLFDRITGMNYEYGYFSDIGLEFNALLAALSFSDKPEKEFGVQVASWWIRRSDNERGAHYSAETMVFSQNVWGDEYKEGAYVDENGKVCWREGTLPKREVIVTNARRFLNDTYRDFFGLSYEEILQPLQKEDKN